MERITIETFDKCPLLTKGFKITGIVKKKVYLSNPKPIAITGLLQCTKCHYKGNGCTPYANVTDLHEIMIKIE
jgi:hypothetical protein